MKPCTDCGTRNEARSLFCNECGKRLPGQPGRSGLLGTTTDASDPSRETSADDPRTKSMHGEMGDELARAGGVGSPPTPVAPVRAPVGRECPDCGYRLPSTRSVRWCPGCGHAMDGSGSVDPVRTTVPPAAPVSQDDELSPGRTATVNFQVASPAVASASPVADTEVPGEPPPVGWALVVLKAGQRLDRHALRESVNRVGREEGEITFSDDRRMSPLHARIVARRGQWFLEDAGSRNGIFLRLEGATVLQDREVLSIGGLVFRFERVSPPPRPVGPDEEDGVRAMGSGDERAVAHLVRLLRDGSDGPRVPLTAGKTVIGRKIGHFLFPDDPLVSRQHVQFYERAGRMMVEDLGSSNGTLVRVTGSTPLERGSVLRIGDTTLEVTGP